MFDEVSMMKASSSQQVENKITKVLQWVKFDASPYVQVSFTSKKTPKLKNKLFLLMSHKMKKINDVVDNDDSIAIRRPKR